MDSLLKLEQSRIYNKISILLEKGETATITTTMPEERIVIDTIMFKAIQTGVSINQLVVRKTDVNGDILFLWQTTAAMDQLTISSSSGLIVGDAGDDIYIAVSNVDACYLGLTAYRWFD